MTSLQSVRPRGSAQALPSLAAPAPDVPRPPPPPSRLRQLLALLPGHHASSATADDAAARAEYASLLALLDAIAAARAAGEGDAYYDAAAVARRHARRIVRLEECLMALARALHNGGCPAWRLQLHLTAAARGLGLPQTAVHVFPHHVTFAFSRFLSAESAGAKTLSVATAPGLDLALLERADALARRLSAFATSSVPEGANVARNGAGDEGAVAAAASSAAAGWAAASRAALARQALDAAALGPGFFRDESGDSDSEDDGSGDGDDDGSGDDDDASGTAAPAPAETDEEAASRPLRALRLAGSSAAALFDAAEAEGGPEAALRRATFVDAALDAAMPQLREMAGAAAQYGPAAQVGASAVAAAGCALCFWGANAGDAVLAAALGAWVGALGLAFNGSWGRRSGTRRVAGYELVSAFSVSFLSRAVAAVFARPMCLAAARLGALQWLLQGWDSTAAIMELTHRNAALVGSAHLLVSVVITALLGFGCDLGDMVADAAHLRGPTAADADATCGALARRPQRALAAALEAHTLDASAAAALCASAAMFTRSRLSSCPAARAIGASLAAALAAHARSAEVAPRALAALRHVIVHLTPPERVALDAARGLEAALAQADAAAMGRGDDGSRADVGFVREALEAARAAEGEAAAATDSHPDDSVAACQPMQVGGAPDGGRGDQHMVCDDEAGDAADSAPPRPKRVRVR